MKPSSIWGEYEPDHITRMINQAFSGDSDAAEEILPLVYQELKLIAARQRRAQVNSSDILNTTAVVHEAWIRIHEHGQHYHNRSHFLAVAAMAMRQLLVDEARKQMRLKRGGDLMRVTYSEDFKVDDQAVWLIRLDQALDELGRYRARLLNVFQLRFFAGMTEEEVAQALEISPPTVRRDWAKAKAMLSVVL